ncbi:MULTISPECIES: carbamoyltransferase N-terminal domain-containing protein [Prochlorococcus]|uniref:carbamoyltransferase N-terminal domain-containing protein n=1 Tax=Prochlorococcus TaxID=1218 RepID=UPI000533A981|nr:MULTISPECIES: carbamoyltransferase N-terminal domain-containing protein [Prochlorococcus]KGG11890.1 Nodulation protein nolO [Prochlorococcus sp. MIT 0601]
MFIGISAYNHESAVALVDSKGTLVDYYREESLSRIKGDKSFPLRAMKRIIFRHDLKLNTINSVAFYEKPLSAFLHPIKVASNYVPSSIDFLVHQFRNFNKSSIACYLDISKVLPGIENKLIYLDHHLAHTLTALAYSDIHQNICSVVIDGFGDRSTSSISYVEDCFNIKELWSCEYPSSLGLFYSAITDYLGFTVNEGEYKVMGLAAFGSTNNPYAKLMDDLIYWDEMEKQIKLKLEYFDFYKSVRRSYSDKLVCLLGEARDPFSKLMPGDCGFQKYADIARATQDLVVNLLIKIFKHAHQVTQSRNFLFSGGVALNTAALPYIARLSFIDKIIIPPSPGDAGAAIGAAYFAYLQSNLSAKTIIKPSLYPSNYSVVDQEVQLSKILNEKFEFLSRQPEESLLIAAELISNGQIVGTIVSNNETGPRSLGNRSILCNGKNREVVNTLNTVIKNRSPFRPTAPAMTLQTAKKYYLIDDALIESYFSMSATCFCKPESNALNFPVTHVDGSARIQIVQPNTLLSDLLQELEPIGIDILANSSLNISGDPTCFDLIDGIMVSSLTPLNYLLTDLGILKKK